MINNNNPLVSIVIPVYNGSNFMKEAIDSALNQTYKNIEIIVINDGSNDNGETEKIALSYGDAIRYYSKENGGVATALNLGIEKMNGDYFSWLSHDDLYLPKKIELQVEAIDIDNKREVIVCKSSLIDKDKNIIPSPRKNSFVGRKTGKEMFIDVFNRNRGLNGCALLIPILAFEESGEFNDLKYTQDIECWARMMIKDYSFLFIDDILVYTRVHNEQSQYNLSHLYRKELKMFSNMVVAYALAYAEDKEHFIKAMLRYSYHKNNLDSVKYIKRNTKIKSDMSCYIFYIKGFIYRFLRYFYHRFVKLKSFNS